MAQSKDNIVTHGLSGLVGRMLVFRQFFGKTVVARRPHKTVLPPSANQEQIQARFREAALYAKTAILDPDTKAAYTAVSRPGQSAYNMAFADYFKPPVLSEPYILDYTGQPSQSLQVRAIDNFMVNSVSVAIRKPDGTLLESGEAVIKANGLDWEYSTTLANSSWHGSKVVFTATDLPGNNTSLEILIP